MLRRSETYFGPAADLTLRRVAWWHQACRISWPSNRIVTPTSPTAFDRGHPRQNCKLVGYILNTYSACRMKRTNSHFRPPTLTDAFAVAIAFGMALSASAEQMIFTNRAEFEAALG